VWLSIDIWVYDIISSSLSISVDGSLIPPRQKCQLRQFPLTHSFRFSPLVVLAQSISLLDLAVFISSHRIHSLPAWECGTGGRAHPPIISKGSRLLYPMYLLVSLFFFLLEVVAAASLVVAFE
jgi:hypothetical protein